jgi:ribokinase
MNTMPHRPRIVVVGSINMDLIVRVARLPVAGETIRGRELLTLPGGKGANQAVAAARLGADVTLVGCVGSDEFGVQLREGLRTHGVGTHDVRTVAGSSGLALISVADDAQNSITVIPGANQHVVSSGIEAAEGVLSQADVLLVQLEIPLPAVERALELARRHSVLTVLNPAPAAAMLPGSLLDVDVLCPNETEAAILVRGNTSSGDAASDCVQLAARGSKLCVVTCGSAGCVWSDGRNAPVRVAPFVVDAVDSTAAGDAFVAALAVRLAEGERPAQALSFASAAGALACTRIGAQASLPDRAAVESLLKQ